MLHFAWNAVPYFREKQNLSLTIFFLKLFQISTTTLILWKKKIDNETAF